MRNAERGTRNERWRKILLTLFLLCGEMVLVSSAVEAEDPDELYAQGRFAEAEKIYARSDMDHPKDLKYRYNRGCADYQSGDYKGAMAAFSSVLKRAEDKEIRFRAAYNLGNAAFKQGDAASAAEYYRQAVRIDPTQEHARHNLEIALRTLEARKKEKEEKEKSSGQEADRKNSRKEGEKDRGREKPSPDDPSGKDGDQEKKPDTENGADNPEEPGQQDEGEEPGQGQDQRPDHESPKDLSGDLKPREALPEPSEEPEGGPPAVSSMDKKKAEALLDNVTEDRAKLLRFQMPEGKRRGVVSGKDW
ncbi:MAG: tetratricopeptide repeat protein [Candidatus Desulfacyla sp.]